VYKVRPGLLPYFGLMCPVLSALLPVLKFWPSDEGVVPSPQFAAKGCRNCALTSSARAGLGHLGEPKIDAIGQDRRQQQRLVPGGVTGFQMCEVPGETRPLINFHQEFGDLDVRQQHRRLVDQGLRGLRHRRIQRRDLQAGLGKDGIRQIIGRRHAVNGGELLFQQCQSVVQILIAIRGHGKQ
jgi:hypothetical protein